MINLLAHVNNVSQQGQSPDYSGGMMGGWPMMGIGCFGSLLGSVVWVLVITVLVVIFRWFWLKGSEEKGMKNEF